jgi:hypothetical protein
MIELRGFVPKFLPFYHYGSQLESLMVGMRKNGHIFDCRPEALFQWLEWSIADNKIRFNEKYSLIKPH